jgi:hypothetical protein
MHHRARLSTVTCLLEQTGGSASARCPTSLGPPRRLRTPQVPQPRSNRGEPACGVSTSGMSRTSDVRSCCRPEWVDITSMPSPSPKILGTSSDRPRVRAARETCAQTTRGAAGCGFAQGRRSSVRYCGASAAALAMKAAVAAPSGAGGRSVRRAGGTPTALKNSSCPDGEHRQSSRAGRPVALRKACGALAGTFRFHRLQRLRSRRGR